MKHPKVEYGESYRFFPQKPQLSSRVSKTEAKEDKLTLPLDVVGKSMDVSGAAAIADDAGAIPCQKCSSHTTAFFSNSQNPSHDHLRQQ